VAEDVAAKRTGTKWTDYLTARNIIGAIIVFVALLFIFQNTQTGDFHFLFFDIKAPRWLWLSGVFAAGWVAGMMFTHHRAAKRASAK
jgi:uncharacterized integral membrane protein